MGLGSGVPIPSVGAGRGMARPEYAGGPSPPCCDGGAARARESTCAGTEEAGSSLASRGTAELAHSAGRTVLNSEACRGSTISPLPGALSKDVGIRRGAMHGWTGCQWGAGRRGHAIAGAWTGLCYSLLR